MTIPAAIAAPVVVGARPPLLSVVVVSYQSRELLARCLADLARVRYPFEVLVIDNASLDGTVESVSRDYPEHRIIANPVNVGFARAVNQAILLCRGEFTLLLNPDTSFDATAIETLVDVLHNEPSIGAVAPLVEHEAGRRRVLDAGRQCTTWRLACHTFGLSRLSRRLGFLEGSYLLSGVHDDVRRDVEWAGGACLMVRSSLLTDLGGLSERWFMYAEDLELSLRITGRGYRIVHEPAARIVHRMAASSVGADKRKAANVTWALAFADYHRSSIAKRRGPDLAWRSIFIIQLVTRALNCRFQAIRHPADRREWAAESRDFIACAGAVVRRA